MKNCKSNNNAKIIKGLEETISYLRTWTSEVSERCIQYQREAIARLKEQEETRIVICQKCGEEIEVKMSLFTKPDMEAIAKRDAFLSDKNGKKLNDAMQSLWGED